MTAILVFVAGLLRPELGLLASVFVLGSKLALDAAAEL